MQRSNVFDTGLTAYWIEPTSSTGPPGLGVTARVIDDTLHIVRQLGYGTARVALPDGAVSTAEVRRYEAHGVGRVEMNIKRFIE